MTALLSRPCSVGPGEPPRMGSPSVYPEMAAAIANYRALEAMIARGPDLGSSAWAVRGLAGDRAARVQGAKCDCGDVVRPGGVPRSPDRDRSSYCSVWSPRIRSGSLAWRGTRRSSVPQGAGTCGPIATCSTPGDRGGDRRFARLSAPRTTAGSPCRARR